MRKNRLAVISLILVFFGYWLSVPVAFAVDRNSTAAGAGSAAASTTNSRVSVGSGNPERGVIIGEAGSPSIPVQDVDSTSDNRDPVIEEVNVLGDLNRSAKGIGYFKDITISLVADNLTDDNFLSPEGLHWSSRTGVELIKGQILGDFDFSTFPNDVPNARVKAFRINDGDSGRITYVGKTRSGIDLDLIWTVTGSDKEDWEANSGFANSKVKGLGFIGEQFFSGASGNSIAVLYDNASNLGLRYQIVRHGSQVEQPVVVSFISTDIDSAQGVETDLANLVEIIPPDSHLLKNNGIIYDTTRGAVNLNGSADLPRGGYLGAGFLSSFNYVFYSPAPERVNNSYLYPLAVRYDIFGSSLQAKITPRLRQHISVRYVDTKGLNLKPEERFKGFIGETYSFSAPVIDKYRLVNIEKEVSDTYRPRVRFIYSPIQENASHNMGKTGSAPARPQHSPPFYTSRNQPPNWYYFNRQGRSLSPVKPRPKKALTNKRPAKKSGHTASTNKSKRPRDPFLVNTGMTKKDKKLFLDYVEEISRQASKKYPKDSRKRYHFIANAIAYPVYKNNELQSLVNDFGDKPKVRNYGEIYNTLGDVHYYNQYIIDFPHLATTLASAEKSNPYKERLKRIAGVSSGFFLGGTPRDNFFQLNSLTGDVLTNIDKKDRNTDIDSIIFHYHPEFRNLPLDEAISQYYGMENLAAERERLYREVLKEQAGSHLSPQEQEKLNIFLAAFTLGGVALVGLSLARRAKKQFEIFSRNPSKYIDDLKKGFCNGVKGFFKDPLGVIGSKVLGPAANLLADSLVMGAIIVKKSAGIVGDFLVKYLTTPIKKYFVKPLSKYVLAPIYRRVVKPLWSFTEKKILKPVVQKVVKPVVRFVQKKIIRPLYRRVVKPAVRYMKNKIVKPAVKYVSKRILKPIYKHVIKPLARKVFKPVYRHIIKPVYNKLIKPVIKPMYSKVIRPTARFLRNKIVKPARRFFKNKIVKPVKRFFKRLWR